MSRLVLLAVAAIVVASCGSTTADDDAADAEPQVDAAVEPELEPDPTPPGPEPEPTVVALDEAAPAEANDELFPDVLDVTLTASGDGVFTVAATLSSPYDSAARYADAWRVLGPDGAVLGIRELLHDHRAEQPFTRSLPDLAIPAGIDEVTVEGRDQISGWGGATITVAVPSS